MGDSAPPGDSGQPGSEPPAIWLPISTLWPIARIKQDLAAVTASWGKMASDIRRTLAEARARPRLHAAGSAQDLAKSTA